MGARSLRFLGAVVIHFSAVLDALVKVSLRILAGSLCAARGGISDHARRKCLGVGASHFLASSAVMAEAPVVIDPAVTKSNAADLSLGLIIANLLSAKDVRIAT
jgi:hypothetical protein